MTSRRGLLALAASTALPSRPARAARDIHDVPMRGDVRIIHQTDTHANARPARFREPSQNIGLGAARGRPPHLVGEAFLDFYGMHRGTRDAHAFTFLDFERLAHRYGRLGGFAALKTTIDLLRAGAGPGRSLLLDGGDLCQGSGIANLEAGLNMVALGNLLGIDAMTGHWEFTYGQDGVAAIVRALHGEFLAQNVFLSAEAAMTGAPAHDPATGQVFPGATIRELGGWRIGVIGQAFPYVPVAHPRRLTPDWRFGLRLDNLRHTIAALRPKVDALLLLSHNGMEVDLKLAGEVEGIDAILGGHTHDAVPRPVLVRNRGGATIVTNAGSAGKFVAVLDLELARGRVRDLHYRLLPVYADRIRPDAAMAAAVAAQEAPHRTMLDESLATVETLLYRRNNFHGTVDQVIVDALLQELDAEIAFSPGFRWGNTILSGTMLTMGDLLGETAITYPAVYTQAMTGAAIKAMMEDVCDNLFNPDPYYQQGGDMIRAGGMNYACTPAAPMGKRISRMELADGTPIEAGKTYKVAGWASVSLPQAGRPVWQVVAENLRRRKTIRLAKPSRVAVLGVAGNPGYAGA